MIQLTVFFLQANAAKSDNGKMDRLPPLMPALLLFLSSCATWTGPIESVDVLPMKKWAAGAGIGMAPNASSVAQNNPPNSSQGTLPDFFLNGRFGFGSGWEATLDASYLILTASAFPRIRKQWLETQWSDVEFASVISLGGFFETLLTFGDVNPNHASSNLERNSVNGFGFSNSFGLKWSDGWQIYAGPKLYWIHWSADYLYPTSTLSWTGFAPGAFIGTAYKWVTHHRLDLQFDLMANFLSMPANLVDGKSSLWPGVRFSVQMIPHFDAK